MQGSLFDCISVTDNNEQNDRTSIYKPNLKRFITPTESMHRDWERGTFQCYATPTGGNNSMAAGGNYACFKHFFSLKNTLLFVRLLPTPTKYGIISLFR